MSAAHDTPASDPRREGLARWLAGLPDVRVDAGSLRPASSDASFRRYFRADAGLPGHTTLIAMDAPPDREDCRAFVQVARRFAAAGAATPDVLAADFDQGYLLLSDLGTLTYADAIAEAPPAEVHALYLDAIDTLVRIQRASPAGSLPPYDVARLGAELQLFPDWFVGRHLGAALTDAERTMLEGTFDLLVRSALAQPQVDVHRDYHCRNLMRLPTPATAGGPRNPGVLDFQDAVTGPVTYDLVSLLRDAYVDWDEALQIDWAVRYWERARKAGVPVADDFGMFWRDLEWMGLQRHLKVLGIFARLWHRDGKDRYLADLPRVLRQARAVARRYDAFAGLLRLLDRIAPDPDTVSGFTF